ncbi:hypothetical protein C5E16_14345 [Clavibacter michiganensis]|uniref:Uncharacterized protein n=1 Tax=Clavibacter michiganensis TaxID=28447 RepID=A0A2S5VNT9_9MICO|nr:hypothetical protein [Clavibacter michiganensis]PPF64736.1 hypothetical protein C5E16_14345 [Clavibacter michiganensis]
MNGEFDLLDADLPDPDETANMSRRGRRRAKKATARRERAQRIQDREAKVRAIRSGPRSSVALLIVGVVFFGGIYLVGSATQNTDATPVPLLTYRAPTAASTPAASPTPDTAAFEASAATWVRAYFAGADWRSMTADGAESDLAKMRATYFPPTPGALLAGNTSDVADIQFRDVASSGTGWSGNVDVLFGGERDIPVSASITITMTRDTGEVTSATTTFYGQV